MKFAGQSPFPGTCVEPNGQVFCARTDIESSAQMNKGNPLVHENVFEESEP